MTAQRRRFIAATAGGRHIPVITLNIEDRREGDDLSVLVAHEYGHVLPSAVAGCTRALPEFEIEGDAEYFASLVAGPDQRRLSGRFQKAADDRVKNIAAPLSTMTGNASSGNASAYPRGYAAMRLLTSRWGLETFIQLYVDGRGGSPDTYLQQLSRVTGDMSLDQFDREVSTYLRSNGTPSHPSSRGAGRCCSTVRRERRRRASPYNGSMTTDRTPEDIAARLTAALGRDQVVTDPDELAALGHDQLRPRRAFLPGAASAALPIAAVHPRCTEDVVATVRIAARAGAPIVERGGGTGLMGGALVLRPAIVLDMRSMNRVLAVAAEDRTVTAEAGAVLAEVGDALAPHGLILGHDPWTVPIATVGGTISTNSLGYRGAKYGSMGDQVLGLEVVLPDGNVLRTRAVPRSSTGPRLSRLFVGAEGEFGVITAATLRVFPEPERRELLALDFPGFAPGFEAVLEMFAVGLTPALIDYGASPDEPARMYLGFEGPRDVVEAETARGRAICARRGATELGDAAARAFWEERHVSPERLRGWRTAERGEPQPGEPGSAVFDYLHIALPASKVLPYIDAADAIFARHGVAVREWGLWNQPELLSTVIARTTDTPEELAQVVTAVDEALMLAQDMGGSMEYVHGAGIRYAHLMAREHGAGLDLLRSLKRIIDPEGLLNPGKLGL